MTHYIQLDTVDTNARHTRKERGTLLLGQPKQFLPSESARSGLPDCRRLPMLPIERRSGYAAERKLNSIRNKCEARFPVHRIDSVQCSTSLHTHMYDALLKDGSQQSRSACSAGKRRLLELKSAVMTNQNKRCWWCWWCRPAACTVVPPPPPPPPPGDSAAYSLRGSSMAKGTLKSTKLGGEFETATVHMMSIWLCHAGDGISCVLICFSCLTHFFPIMQISNPNISEEAANPSTRLGTGLQDFVHTRSTSAAVATYYVYMSRYGNFCMRLKTFR